MYIKLALRNLRRSARDYGIYFLTVAVTVALMESFLALACARDVLSLSENMGILTTGIVGVSVLVALLSSCVIAYGVGFMLGQRKQEFALYQLMGMELRTVQRMFFWENGLLGLAAFGLGALLGTGLAGVLAQGVWWIFQTPHQYQVVASPKALGMTFLLFLLMYGVGALRAGRVLRRQSIQGLLTSRRANEVPGRWRPGRWFLLVAPALTGMALGLLLLRKALDMQTNGAWAWYSGRWRRLLLGGVYALYRGCRSAAGSGPPAAQGQVQPGASVLPGADGGAGGHGGTGAGGDGDSAHPGSDRPVCGAGPGKRLPGQYGGVLSL